MTSPFQDSARAILRSYLQQWGLLELEGDLDRLIKDGLGADAIQLQLSETAAYKRRFAGNEARTKAGLPVLSPAEYLSVEASYRQALSQFGIPSGFYDSADDFVQFMAHDISPEELATRARAAQQTWLTTDAATRAAWTEFYGLTDGAAIAAILDPNRAAPIVQRMATAAQLGGVATRNGLAGDRDRFERYADLGVTVDQASQAFGDVGLTLGTEQAIAHRFGIDYTQADAEGARLGVDGAARKKQAELARSEQALFDNRSTADANSLNRRTTGKY